MGSVRDPARRGRAAAGVGAAAGVPVLRTMGQGEPMLLALKSGNFGGRDFFSRALDLMR